jgi:hypothetical protein
MTERSRPPYGASGRSSTPPIPRDEPEDDSKALLRRAVRDTPAVELPTPVPPRPQSDRPPRPSSDRPPPWPSPLPPAPALPSASNPPASDGKGGPKREATSLGGLSATPRSRPKITLDFEPLQLRSSPPPGAVSTAVPESRRGSASNPAPASTSSPPPSNERAEKGERRAEPTSAPPPDSSPIRRRAKKLWTDAEWQKLWLATQRRGWRSLAVLAGSKGMTTSPLEVASALADVGWQHLGRPIHVVDARETTLGHVETRISEVSLRMSKGDRVIVVLSSVFDNPATLPIARAADAALICVLLGQSEMSEAEQTVDEIGRERFLGSVVLKDPPRAAAPATDE